ncbi:phosphoribosyl-AMP cyclohydrolase [Halorussus gelatinilyticus]|uniref:Phosphoribosyl-AMP cyclohydrolase n=1 Tax=Halorussus gelatinilyticus TaxID=2937524 RepID=A0A8U0IMJ8_9EURY|nr:phosphoribosyl-AMP cyclohydrolase [Halorussus gelatinilyticus]UPW01978.1 phosphoribosyl-AMP cyclohydrolase [Halorussus gelatinilyticus]
MSDAHTAETDGDAERDPEGGREDALDAAVELDFGETGRIPAIAQDADTGDVLMLAYVTPEAVEQTRETGLAHYYSRSREELWQKGATSGHVQRVREVRADCDGDALLYLVEQEGGACHTGYESCFYRTLDGEVVGEKAFDPDDVYE